MRLSTDRSTWLGHQSWLVRGRFVTCGVGPEITGFCDSLAGLSVWSVPTGLVLVSRGFGSVSVTSCLSRRRAGRAGRAGQAVAQAGQRPQ